jgi:hypothetical protein
MKRKKIKQRRSLVEKYMIGRTQGNYIAKVRITYSGRWKQGKNGSQRESCLNLKPQYPGSRMWTVTIKIIKLLKLKRSKTKRLAFE